MQGEDEGTVSAQKDVQESKPEVKERIVFSQQAVIDLPFRQICRLLNIGMLVVVPPGPFHTSLHGFISPKINCICRVIDHTCIHCLAVKPLARENCEPFSTMYSAEQTLHFNASGLSALCEEQTQIRFTQKYTH